MLSSQHSKTLCMTRFSIELSTIPRQKFFSTQKNEKLSAAFIYIEKGSAELCTNQSTLRLTPLSLVFIPEDTFYSLKWTANEEIKYYTIVAVSKDYSTPFMNDGFTLQKIEALSTEKTGQIFAEIYALMSTEERIKKIEAVSVYYSFYAKVLRHLTEKTEPELHPALTKAVEFIEKNYNKDHTLSQIAKNCFISETRLFHLFKTQLNTTPVSYRNKKRIETAAELLKTEQSVEEICSIVGFNSIPYFYETFKKYTAITPKEYRKLM